MADTLAQLVNKKLAEGYVLVGGVAVGHGIYQAVARPDEPEDDGTVAIKWTVGDVKAQCDTLTDDEATEVLHYLKRHHDATIGINWDVIDSAVQHLYPEKYAAANEENEEWEYDAEETDEPTGADKGTVPDDDKT